MRKLLPIFLSVVFLVTTLFSPEIVAAQTQLQAPTPLAVPTGGLWVVDPEVTFIGKNAARSGLMLDWTLQNYSWVCVNPRNARTPGGDVARVCDDSNNPLAKFWGQIVLYIVVPLLFFVILATAAVIIITRGKSLTIMRFIPRFVAVILLIVFSYSLLQFLYQFFDLIQGFFLRSNDQSAIPCPPNCISQKDLLYVGWDYRAFIGLRLLGDYNAESAFISLLLTKLTALTYFVMVGILLMRKIILWFFIIVSPIFPLLLLYYPVRNTGKIWIGEFFRWLLYAPLFAIFLKGLVSMWRSQIPLVFDNPNIGNATQIVFPTAVNILLGGPKQFVTPTNSVNLTETFALYVVALIMLWIVILLPWILLQIFLDYAANFSPGDSAVMKTLVNLMGNKKVPPPVPGGQSPEQPGGSGIALNLPFTKKFNVPVSVKPEFKPTGMAKEIERSTIESRFAQPISMPNAQVNAQVLSLANVSMPSMRDIAKYETALLSKDSSQKQEVSQMTQTLERIANPVAVTSTVEREKYVEIREKISNESQQGNQVATSIMNAVSAISNKTAKASNNQIKSVLSQISNPASASVNREKLSKLHEMLSKESKENNNQLASSLMSVSEKTTDTEIEKIKEQLTQAVAQGNSMASSVMSTINSSAQHAQNTTQVKNVLQQVANPAAATGASNVKMTKLHESLLKASKEGNDVATAVLSVSDKTSNMDIEKLQEKIMQAKDKGNPIAAELAGMTQSTAALPVVNRVQTVTKDDYEAVKNMWKDNYHNLEVPKGMAGTRQEWITDDIAKIDSIVGLLSSSDQEKVQEGMQQVSDILPFLLVGGFSQTEIIAYLKAKQDAAKDVAQELSTEEEEKVTVEAGHAEAQKTMAATMDEGSQGSAPVSSSAPSTSVPSDDESPLVNLGSVEQSSVTNMVQPQISNDILVMANLKLPKMRDIARYETSILKKDKTQIEEAAKVKEVLERIANPAPIGTGVERDRYEKLRERLVEESQKGNKTADIILSAALRVNQKADEITATLAEMKTVLRQISKPETVSSETDKDFYTRLHDYLAKEGTEKNNQLANKILAITEGTSVADIDTLKADLLKARQQGDETATKIIEALNNYVQHKQSRSVLEQLANPSTIASSKEKQYFTKLHDDLTKASSQGNAFATSLLAIKDTSTHGDIENVNRQLKEAKEKGDPLASQVLSSMTDASVPVSNRIQPVSDEDYEEVKKLWEENYRNLPVPVEFTPDDKGRIEWIQADSKQIEETVGLLTSPDTDKRNEGVKKVAGILPFLLLGGFSYSEMVGYLSAKLEAAKTVITVLQTEEGQKVTVDAAANKTEEAKTMTAEVEEKKKS